MPNLSNQDINLGQNFWLSSVGQMHPLGTRGYMEDGRAFVYCRAGAADLVAGNVIQASAPIAGNLAQTPTAAAIGATTVIITTITTTVTLNQYAGGYLGTDTTPGNGLGPYLIAGHSAATGGSGACTITLYPDDPLQVALTTASRVGLMANPYADVIQAPTTKTAAIVGVAPYIIKATQYGWIQTWGACSVLINGTPAVTAPVINGGTTAGSVDVFTTAAMATATYLGEMMQVGVSTKNNFVFLRIGH